QFFKPLGFTIVYCMIASCVGSITIVPLCYVFFKPHEKNNNLMSKVMEKLQGGYRTIISGYLRHKVLVVIVSVVFILLPLLIVPTFKTELVPECDEGKIQISIETKPSKRLAEKDELFKRLEAFVASKDYVDNYCLECSSGGLNMLGRSSAQSIKCYLVDKDKRDMTTRQIINSWRKELADVTDCTLDISLYGTSVASMFVMPASNKFEKYIESKDLKAVERVNDKIKKELQGRPDVSSVTTQLDYGAPMIKVKVDPILAASEGFTPALIGQQLNLAVSGKELYDMVVDDETYAVYLEYEKDEYGDIDKVENILLTSNTGHKTMLKDVAEIVYADSPNVVSKYNKMYRDRIQAFYNENKTDTSEEEILNIIKKNLVQGVSIGKSQMDEYLNEEFTSLTTALLVAVFLVFIVMASQFESVKYSLLVMGTILFAITGAVYALWFAAVKLSLVGMLSLMLLIGTAVNNGILYVDTTNQFIDEGMDRDKALVEAGAIRMRPMFMTTITTIVSVLPMALAYGNNGELLQSLGLVNLGGLIASTVSALLALPILYDIFSKSRENLATRLANSSKIAIRDYEKEKEARIVEED
ncbi:MAG: efflux RND transporter permease subunit, partial [Lachnospiraceae bacterium]|nr:efflux RND transporter permease subunit [Lachnospiraceae bacterium]